MTFNQKIKTALIIGVSGQDGSYLARSLLGKGYRVVGTSRDAHISTFDNLLRLAIRNQVETESMALNDFRSVIQVLAKFNRMRFTTWQGKLLWVFPLNSR